MNWRDFLPVSGWKAAVGLFLFVVVAIAVANKLKIQQKVSKAVGA